MFQTTTQLPRGPLQNPLTSLYPFHPIPTVIVTGDGNWATVGHMTMRNEAGGTILRIIHWILMEFT